MTVPLVIEVEVASLPVQAEVDASPQVIVSPGSPLAVIAAVPGIAGPPGDGTPVVGQAPTGTRDGVNAAFTTTQNYRTGTTAVFRNGLREVRGVGYTETGANTITFSAPPLVSDDIAIDYIIE